MDRSNNSSLRGKRYRNLLRVSTLLNDASIVDQQAANTRFANSHGMTHAGHDEVLEGVSGSKTFNRHDLKRLLKKAQYEKDYDVLLVYDSSRLTRGGAGHGYSIRREFAKAGVLILSVMDPVPEGDFKDVTQAIIDKVRAMEVSPGNYEHEEGDPAVAVTIGRGDEIEALVFPIDDARMIVTRMLVSLATYDDAFAQKLLDDHFAGDDDDNFIWPSGECSSGT